MGLEEVGVCESKQQRALACDRSALIDLEGCCITTNAQLIVRQIKPKKQFISITEEKGGGITKKRDAPNLRVAIEDEESLIECEKHAVPKLRRIDALDILQI